MTLGVENVGKRERVSVAGLAPGVPASHSGSAPFLMPVHLGKQQERAGEGRRAWALSAPWESWTLCTESEPADGLSLNSALQVKKSVINKVIKMS